MQAAAPFRAPSPCQGAGPRAHPGPGNGKRRTDDRLCLLEVAAYSESPDRCRDSDVGRPDCGPEFPWIRLPINGSSSSRRPPRFGRRPRARARDPAPIRGPEMESAVLTVACGLLSESLVSSLFGMFCPPSGGRPVQTSCTPCRLCRLFKPFKTPENKTLEFRSREVGDVIRPIKLTGFRKEPVQLGEKGGYFNV